MEAYEKGETLGQGTFGVVYRAVHKEVRVWVEWGGREGGEKGHRFDLTLRPTPTHKHSRLAASSPSKRCASPSPRRACP